MEARTSFTCDRSRLDVFVETCFGEPRLPFRNDNAVVVAATRDDSDGMSGVAWNARDVVASTRQQQHIVTIR
jgi:hypothetical protein